ncbi:O-antigen ligase family protein [Acinetobacter sp. 251-1]|uniref:O-antigen ligase family protein n=1 Tax=Acinetobacter sp. 251-1 TaxID=2746720 RepID=UPI002577F428|nr:O-antigen ligase family protein [Acinetobacter sp. 251-1]MDM1761698.1 O-antigen ligase family protein [Acinetobacter sp. 251-1]
MVGFLSLKKLSYLSFFLIVTLIFFSGFSILPTLISNIFLFSSIILIVISVLYVLVKHEVDVKELIFIFIFILPVTISYVYNINSYPNLNRFILFSFFYPLLFIFFKYIVGNFSLNKVILPFLVCSVIVVVLSSISSFGLYEFNIYDKNTETLETFKDLSGSGRLFAMTGIYLNQNTFAPILIVGFFTFLLFILNDLSVFKKNVIIVLAILNLIMFVLTLARGPIFALLVSMILFFILSKINFSIKIISFLFLFLFLFLFYQSDYWDIFYTRVDSAGLTYRDVIWADAIKNFFEKPYFGLGFGNYRFFDGQAAFSTHNLYLFFLVSLGIVGSLGIFIFIFILLVNSIYNIFMESKKQNLLLFSCFILTCLIQQSFEVILDTPFNPLSLFFILSSVFILRNKKFSKEW